MKNTSAVKGYKIDFTTNTMIVNYTFNDASKVYGSPEYKLLKNVIADFPDIKIAVKSGREKKSPNKNKRLTYENMLKYISVCENAEEMLDAFESTRIRSQLEASPYNFVCKWFAEQFPEYNKSLIFREGKWQETKQKKQEISAPKNRFSC